MRFRDIPQITKSAAYMVNIPWSYLEAWLANIEKDQTTMGYKVDLDPDFQRAHVWDEIKQRRYVEFVLRGGKSAREIYFNHPGWMRSFKGDLVLVDGKQRLEAVRKFLRNELAVFGGNFYRDFTDRIGLGGPGFIIYINDLETRKEVLQWYLDINDGGIAHTNEEIEKVRVLLAIE